MSEGNGYNPIRYRCFDDKRGTWRCYNEHHHPKVEVFAECFRGRINFGDLDAFIVEVNSRALIMEWKSAPIEIPTGQRITYENLSRTGLLVAILLAGDAKAMTVTHWGSFIAGEFSGWKAGDIEIAKAIFRSWDKAASTLPPVRLQKALPEQKITRYSKAEIDEWIADYEAHESDFKTFGVAIGASR